MDVIVTSIPEIATVDADGAGVESEYQIAWGGVVICEANALEAIQPVLSGYEQTLPTIPVKGNPVSRKVCCNGLSSGLKFYAGAIRNVGIDSEDRVIRGELV